MSTQDIQNRSDLDILVKAFYAKVRKDNMLGDFFNAFIKGEEAWKEHLALLASFWELNLLGISGFNGNPAKAHGGVDKAFKNSITTDHFDKWVGLWTETIDELYAGEMANKAKDKARGMAKGMYKKIIDQRPGGFILPGKSTGFKLG